VKSPGSQFGRFCLVGGVGFIVDAGLTLLITQGFGLSPVLSRAVAFASAASVTWALNSRFTFRSRGGLGSWMPYVLSTSIGALVNGGIYLLWLHLAGRTAAQILVGVALGSAVALVFNFTIARRFIFRQTTGSSA
jgi:putative flippase GtrA